jgi:hypothetical protein
MDINELMNGAYRGNFNRSDDSSDEYLFASATERWGIPELRTRILYEFFGPVQTGEC